MLLRIYTEIGGLLIEQLFLFPVSTVVTMVMQYLLLLMSNTEGIE